MRLLILLWCYTLILSTALPVIFGRLAFRGFKDPFYHEGWQQRLGQPPALDGVLWVHAVSMGETICILPLVRQYIAEHGPNSVYMTVMTGSGAAYLKKNLPQVPQGYIPYDLPFIWKRFFSKGTPKLLVLVETELWPNLLDACKKKGLPIYIANARLSERSTGRYAQLPPALWEPIVGVAAQTQTDAARFASIGIPAARISCVGNLKFDLNLPESLPAQGAKLREQWAGRPVWIAASTHEGEEAAALAAHAQLRQRFPNALLVLVPRHPERFDRVASIVQKEGFSFARRSKGEVCTPDTAVYLADTLGEMLTFYAAVDVAFVGGSIAPVGGHNALEPAALGVPVVMGPEVFNCPQIVAMLEKAGGLKQVTADTLGAAILPWFEDPAARALAGKNAQAVVAQNKGALAHTLAAVNKLVGLISAAEGS